MTIENTGPVTPEVALPDSNREYNLNLLSPPLEPRKLPDMWFKNDIYGESVAMYRVGGVAYPMVTVRQCNTCVSLYRTAIENAIIEGYGYDNIARDLPEDAGGLSGRNIREHHARGHMPLEPYIIRLIQEQRATQLGIDIMTGGTLADYITLGYTVISKVYQRLVRGEVQPDLKDALGFARLIHQAQMIAGSDLDHEMVYEVLVEYQQTVKMFTDDATYQLIAETLSNSPVIRDMIERESREAAQSPPLQEAKVVVSGELEESAQSLSDS